MSTEIGDYIIALRSNKGLDVAELAVAAGISTVDMLSIENGGEVSSIENIVKLCMVLNADFGVMASKYMISQLEERGFDDLSAQVKPYFEVQEAINKSKDVIIEGQQAAIDNYQRLRVVEQILVKSFS